jgi:hypothetical protein
MAAAVDAVLPTADPEKIQEQQQARQSDSSSGVVEVPVLPAQPPSLGPTAKAEKLSIYFTILAAGFGLISDGCKCCHLEIATLG